MDSVHAFFKKHVFIAIFIVLVAELALYEGLWYLGYALHFSFGKSNQAYFVTELILKALPALLISFFIGTLDSLKNPLKNLGNSLLSGALILIISVMMSIVFCVLEIEDGNKIKEPTQIIFFILFVLMVGLSEELLMRGTVTRLLAEKYGKEGMGKVISVLIGALVFGVSHFPNILGTHDIHATLLQVLATTMAGMLICAIYVKWGNLPGVIILHSVFDFAAMSRYGLIAGRYISDKNSRGGGDLKQTLINNSIFVFAAIIVMVHGKKKDVQNMTKMNSIAHFPKS